MEEFQQKLETIKKLVIEYRNTTIDDLQKEIDSIKLRAYKEELESMLSENDGEIESIESYSMDQLVVDDEKIFENLMENKLAELSMAINDLCWEVQCARVYKIDVDVDKNINFVYSYRNFRHKSYQKVYKHYKKNISTKTSSWQHVRKNDEVYKKQRDILAKVISKSMKTSTVVMLRAYGFIDERLKETINRLYWSLTATDYCHLHIEKDINYGIDWFQKFKVA